MIELVSKDKCSGCSACYNACKFGVLTMECDETGFWFPHINGDKCVKCGACMRACPAIEKPMHKKSMEPKAFIVQNKDDEIRKQSTSGGAFTAIAKNIIAKGGVIFGVAIDGNFEVAHVSVESEEDLAKFRNSKYVQSWVGSSYQDAEKHLKNGRQVCFSGTPCQIDGLKKYLGKDYENLLTVDVMCRAVPSPKVLKKYIDWQKEKYPEFDRIVFRDKGRGYSYSGIALYHEHKVLYRGGERIGSVASSFFGWIL